MTRIRPPNRRENRTRQFEWKLPGSASDPQPYFITVGINADGTASEVFINGRKRESEVDAILNDASIFISQLLQRGVPLDDIRAGVGRVLETREPTSAIGAALDCVPMLEEAVLLADRTGQA